MSPLYATLARAISGDTIAAASAWLLAVHLFIHDYFFKISVAYKLSGSLSMVAAVAASLLLASRLGSPQKVVRLRSLSILKYFMNLAERILLHVYA